MSDVKTCSKCREVKSLSDDFTRCASAEDGRQRWCVPCMSAYHRQWRADRRGDAA